jgi:hypothetical protein
MAINLVCAGGCERLQFVQPGLAAIRTEVRPGRQVAGGNTTESNSLTSEVRYRPEKLIKFPVQLKMLPN